MRLAHLMADPSFEVLSVSRSESSDSSSSTPCAYNTSERDTTTVSECVSSDHR